MWYREIIYTLLAFCAIIITVCAFPQGAPVESCDSTLPRHELIKASQSEKSPYHFIASASRYSYSTIPEITVQITGAPFKGFFVTAVDPRTNKRIGSWKKVRGTDLLPCSAVTHVDPYLKRHVTLLWEPPTDKREGDVIFVGTIVQSYSVYYTGQVAAVSEEADVKSLFKKEVF
ncbi:reelin domain-containing protein 1-like [Tachypleus tridentatus]|uniref:reelin domain-containing protein 1-like n=1 Tax=Tachypleus tridentatus TaxID=6853 RepID=UPI003FD5D7B0